MARLTPDRRRIVRDAVGVGLAVGAYGLSFGAIATSAGLSVLQACALSLLLFSGGSQFAYVGAVASGGGPVAAVLTAVLLGTRNSLYGLRLAPLLRVRGVRRFAAAQVTIDESAAMAVAQDTPARSRLAFWSTGLSVFVCWNLATLVGAVGAQSLSDPKVLGLDAAVGAAFLALVAPRLREAGAGTVFTVAALVALGLTPFLGYGLPVLLAAVAAVAAGWRVTTGKTRELERVG
ncbi:MAG TPA: AzlC family ABC transporter permease [Mycobacteriales bacterium]|jgi:predicted branched-subunit amino acid permease|nr:AzlC family protein [Mycobacterium sp.]